MSGEAIHFVVDGERLTGQAGQTILQACDAAGVYVPRLCYHPDMEPGGHCRVCTCKVNGRYTGACHTPISEGMVVENQTPELTDDRRTIIEMLFVEGNHFCPTCEKSGDCELQALGYELGLVAPQLPYLWPNRQLDATHPDIYVDRNRCILCGRCVRASHEVDGKAVFGFENRGIHTRLNVDAEAGLSETNIAVTDKAAQVCPVGCIVIKRTAFEVPYGQRRFDEKPISAEIEARHPVEGKPP